MVRTPHGMQQTSGHGSNVEEPVGEQARASDACTHGRWMTVRSDIHADILRHLHRSPEDSQRGERTVRRVRRVFDAAAHGAWRSIA
ncbi:MAG: hypothetical protein IPG43_14185 [Proteobacteria bacterium]|nr:hypothetical protein [Pseudomonadota bacterium]